MDVCTCHISELRCKNSNCAYLKNIRKIFKEEVAKSIKKFYKELQFLELDRKTCVRALRRELNHKNNLQYDVFEEVAEFVWGEKHGRSNQE